MADNKSIIKNLISDIDKKHGKGIVQHGDSILRAPVLCSTGSLKLDSIFGGGVPQGRIIEIFGPPSGGKTTASLHMIRECQKAGYVAAFIDAEQSFDADYAEKLGVDMKELIVIQPDYGEQGFDIAEQMIRTDIVKLIVIDSVSALQPKAVIDGEYTDQFMGVQARMMSKSLPKINTAMRTFDTCLVFINQIRMKIGVLYGSPETVSGGNALGFYASVRAKVSRKGVIGDKEDPTGFTTKIKLMKSKVSRPFTSVETNLYLGKDERGWGFSINDEIIDLIVEKEYVLKAGAWYSFEHNGNKEKFQGKENLSIYLTENIEVFNYFKDKIMSDLLIKNASVSEVAEEGSFNAVTQEKVEEKPKRKARKKKDEIVVEEIAVVEESNTEESMEIIAEIEASKKLVLKNKGDKE